MQKNFYSKEKLMIVASARGYMSLRTLGDALAPAFGVSGRSVQTKLSLGNLTLSECEVIGSHLEMSMKEYYDVFMNGLFSEDSQGHYIAKVKEEPYMWLHSTADHIPEAPKSKQKPKKSSGKSKVKTAKEILEQLEDF